MRGLQGMSTCLQKPPAIFCSSVDVRLVHLKNATQMLYVSTVHTCLCLDSGLRGERTCVERMSGARGSWSRKVPAWEDSSVDKGLA